MVGKPRLTLPPSIAFIKLCRCWELYSSLGLTNLPPMLLSFYSEVLLPTYREKSADPDFGEYMAQGAIGLTRDELIVAHQKIKGLPLNWDYYRQQMQPQLIASGLIDVRKPSMGDKRNMHVFPLKVS